jgi:hypothetical protein
MENIEVKMLRTISGNFLKCTDLPEDYDEPEEMNSQELINFVKNIRSKIQDNVNMLNTVIEHNSGNKNPLD